MSVRAEELNKPAIRAVLAYIESQPDQWDQRYFQSVDGTMCMAGIACHLAGLDLEQMLVEDGDPMAVYHQAQTLLGLTDEQADRLFLQFVQWLGTTPPTVDQLREEIVAVTGWDLDGDD
jgi:hypothetical protein